MTLKTISVKNYKAFFEEQTIELKPITLLIGKNSAGKSSIAKLLTLLSSSLSKAIEQPILLQDEGVIIGEDYDDLFYGKSSAGLTIDISLCFDQQELSISLFKSNSYGLSIERWYLKDLKKEIEIDLAFQPENNHYIDRISKKEYQCTFSGFIPTQLIDLETEKDLALKIEFSKLMVDYIGPFRVIPERYFALSGKRSFTHTGITGKNAYEMLGVSRSKGEEDILYKCVSDWYYDNFDGWRLIVDNKSKKPLIEILLQKEESNKQSISVNLADVGQGMNQVLPLVVRANIQDKPNSIIVIEQPELHLHPAAHGDIAELFARSALKNKQTFVIETHSENVLLRLRKLAVENDFGFTCDDLVIYWIEDSDFKGKELREITVDNKGVLSDWPEGVFHEGMKELLEMQRAIKRRKAE